MLSAREAHQRYFRKRPFRSWLLPSCLSANQRELVEVRECLPGHFGIFLLLSFRTDLHPIAVMAARVLQYHPIDIGLKAKICERLTVELRHPRESGLQ